MKLILESEHAVLLQPDAQPALDIEAAEPGLAFSPFHMLAAALATCTHAVLWTWAFQARLEADDLHIRVRWEFADSPQRVGALEMELLWASLPEARHAAACRAAELCTVHATLTRPTQIRTRIG